MSFLSIKENISGRKTIAAASLMTLFASVGRKHFLGIICFHSINSDELSIIDGQQRITSLSLLLLAIRNSIEDDRIQEEIKGDYILYYDRGNRKLLPKLKLCQRDAEIYNALVEKNEENLTEKQKKSGLYTNYQLFRELLQNYQSNGGTAEQLYKALEKLSCVQLETEESENPQEIFESINSTGLELKKVDLLRNYFLMQFSQK